MTVLSTHGVQPSNSDHLLSQVKSTSATSADATQIVSSGSVSKSETTGGGAISSFLSGCILIPFALVLLWKNEKKLVTYAKLLAKARKVLKEADPKAPKDEDDYELVHLTGTSTTTDVLLDEAFKIEVSDSYRIKREV